MRLLVVTNLYPPQELGGYGRAIADFVWGLRLLGHHVQVLCSDAPYLGCGGAGPSGEPVDRCLQLKGSFERGVSQWQDPQACRAADQANGAALRQCLAQGSWDGLLVGNLDLLGIEVLQQLLPVPIPLLHHVGFVTPPFAPQQWPPSPHYTLVAASEAVRASLVASGLPVAQAPVVYPGARVELFGEEALGRPLPGPPDGSSDRPLRICFAGLLMASKGPHTVLEAVARLRERGVEAELMLAGGSFQQPYVVQLKQFVQQQGLHGQVHWLGQLRREQLARMFALQHVAVFPSLYPEAFGIVAAEAMASGLALVSSGVGGAAELFEHGVSGLAFRPGDAEDLANQLLSLVQDPALLHRVQTAGQRRVRDQFSVIEAARRLEQLWTQPSPLRL